MKIIYSYDEKLLDLNETANDDDIEFNINSLGMDIKQQVYKIREIFNENKVLTDILVYAHTNQRYQIIVRKDFYNDFIIELFRQQLVTEVKWA
ncbi:hypothetical protein E2K98_23520 [Bacillus salipaludis]|uniref:Uncharacterized protein n=1 Tax=Bacillus salipaludis TaxID=2547811 RepID=A0A4R5VM48_9BACI|nr:hypothetical protein [Bacillus salipaludis]MDQ6596279.1 hypothetical protein [Bacillus salipaludis]TDK58404.1 hypothetical protein E2K98_23520 [Bacillus salipaludis]